VQFERCGEGVISAESIHHIDAVSYHPDPRPSADDEWNR
jgi:hypothetical protein